MKEKKNNFKKDLFKGVVCKERNRKTAGITLIALVITVIILLILAGITISQLTGSGIFEKAKEARNKWQNAQEDEEAKIAKYSNEIDSYVDGDRNDIIETKTITTSKGTYKFTKKGNIVHCSFFDDEIDLGDFKNSTDGIL